MAVGVVRRYNRAAARAVQVLADVQVEVVVAVLAPVALVAGPAVVGGRRRGARDAVDLLPRVPADVAGPELVGPGADGDPERVAEAGRDDPSRVEVGAADVRVAGHRGARR